MDRYKNSVWINAPVEKVWHTMLDDATYREWTKPFHPQSEYRGEWKTGTEIIFGAPNEDGTLSGMISQVREVRPLEYVSVEHIGMLEKGVRDTTSELVKKWAPAQENYLFKAQDGGTLLEIETDLAEEHVGMFAEMWEKALARLKELAEQ